jgi:hypothetical protein
VADPGEMFPEELELIDIKFETPEEIEKREKERQIEVDFRQAFLVVQMQNRTFRRWLMEQLVGFGTFENSFGAGPAGFPDKEATQFAMGMKAAGWHLWTMFDDAAPELASLMRREAAATKEKASALAQPVPALSSEGRAPADAEPPEIVG